MNVDEVNLRSLQVDAAVAEYLSALEKGAPPDHSLFLDNHADIACELKHFLADYQAIEEAIPRPIAAASTDSVTPSTGRTARVQIAPLASPRRFGGFELLEEIARGGMGVVYKARQITPRRTVALKMILAGQFASQADVERFQAEAQAAATLDHPNIVPIFEIGNLEGQHYFVMAFVEGESLAQRLAQGPIAALEAAGIIRDVALAVQYAHDRGIIHRDLKPANILRDADGRVRVTDFGLAKRQADEAGLTQTGQLLGTPSYMSPEQVLGGTTQVGPAADMYSLGATLYALITGRPPHQAASTVETLRQVLERDPIPPRQLDASLPRDLETITLKCLEKSPDRRYENPQALADEVDRFLIGMPVWARPVSRSEHLWRWCLRHPQVAALAASVGLLLVVVAALSTFGYSRAKARQRDAQQAAARETELRAIAEQNFSQAKKTVDDYFTLVSQTKLLDVPGLQPLRKDLLERALQYYQDFAKTHADDPSVASGLAEAYFRVGTIKRIVGDDVEAIDALSAACRIWEIRRDNEQLTPEIIANLATTYANLAVFQSEQGNSAAALELYRNSEALWKELTNQDPHDMDYQLSLARTLDQMALLIGEADPAKASRLQADAHDLFQAISEAAPSDFNTRRYLAGHFVNVAALRAGAGDAPAAIQSLDRAREILEECHDIGAQSLQSLRQLADVHFRLGQLQAEAGDQEKALTSFASAGQIQAALVVDNSTVPALKREYAKTLSDMAIAQLRRRELDDALSTHLASCKLIDELIQMRTPIQVDWLTKLSMIERFASRLRDSGYYSESAIQYQALWELICQHRHKSHKSAAAALSHLALVQAAANDAQGYRTSCEMLLSVFQDSRDPEVANLVAWSCTLRPDGSKDWDTVLRLAEFSRDGEPDNAPYQYALGAALFRAGRLADARPILLGQANTGEFESRVSPGLLLAMLCDRLGQAKEARKWLAFSAEAVSGTANVQRAAKEEDRDLWHVNELERRILLSEAEKVVADSSPNPVKD